MRLALKCHLGTGVGTDLIAELVPGARIALCAQRAPDSATYVWRIETRFGDGNAAFGKHSAGRYSSIRLAAREGLPALQETVRDYLANVAWMKG